MEAPPRFCELIRVSGDAQEARDTPADQRRALDQLRERRPGILVERIDKGAVSGAADERPDLARLFELLAAGAVEEVRVRHIDRLTRHPDPRQRAAILGALIDAKAVVVEASGRVIDPADEMGELDLTLQGWIASRERKRINERTQAGRKRGAAAGRIQGHAPWGRTWDKRTGAWGEAPAVMAAYRQIFREVIAGRSLAEVAARLNRDGPATPRGKEWTPAHVSRLVRHPAAAGVIQGWGRTFECPAVVDAATQRAALAALGRNRQERAGPPGHHPAMLRRVLSCGVCGSAMWVQRGGRTGDVRSYYVCRRWRTVDRGDPCRTYHAVEDVDDAVREEVLRDLRQPARLRTAAARRQAGNPLEEARATLAEADQELVDLDRREERHVRLATKGLISEAVGARQLAEIARLRNAAEAARAGAAARVDALTAVARRAAGEHQRLDQIADALERAGLARWQRFLREQCPPGLGVRLWPDGRTVVSGRWSAAGAARAASR